MNSKLRPCLALILSGVLLGCSTPRRNISVAQTSANSGNNNPSKYSPLYFLADIPSLKNVSLSISEQELLNILRQQKIAYTKEIEKDGAIIYNIHPKEDVIVIFSFRKGHCSGIQRIRG
jgi:hypothetical protein